MSRHATFYPHRHGLGSPRSGARVVSALIGTALLLSVSAASAATDIQGTPDDLHISVRNATITEVLTALSARFNITVRARSQNPHPHVLTGTYSGTLRQTLTRILDGNDYVFERSDRGLEILILGASATDPQNQQKPPSRPVVAASAAPAHAPTTAPRPSVASSKPAAISNPSPPRSGASVPPLSSFAMAPPVTP
jgi:hypothetical protein